MLFFAILLRFLNYMHLCTTPSFNSAFCITIFLSSVLWKFNTPSHPNFKLSNIQNKSEAATSTFPPAASSELIATSLVAPKSINNCILSSGCRLGGAGALCRLGEDPLPGAEPSVCPEPGNDGPPPVAPLPLASEVDDVPSISSGKRALLGNSCSERNLTSRPWMRSTPFSRSMHA